MNLGLSPRYFTKPRCIFSDFIKYAGLGISLSRFFLDLQLVVSVTSATLL